MGYRPRKLSSAIFLFFITLTLFTSFSRPTDSLFSQNSQPLNGILIEGMDCSGKSTISSILEDKLKELGHRTNLNHCYLSNHILVRFLLKKAIETDGTKDESIFHACATLLDQLLFKRQPDIFYIQDRNWFSQQCWLTFFAAHTNYSPPNFILTHHQSFEWNIYLTLNYETYATRFLQRTKKSKQNRELYENRELFEQYAQHCLSLLPKSENWIVIPVDNKSPEEIVEHILMSYHLDIYEK